MGKYKIAGFLALYGLACTNGIAETVKDDKKQETIFLREDAVLSDKGDFSSELGVFFRRQTGTRADNLVKRETSFASLTLRYGINRRSQLTVSAPYQYIQDDELSLQNVPIGDTSVSGWGDVVVSFKHQVWFEHGNFPDLIVSISADSDTGDIDRSSGLSLGSGHWEYTLSVLAAKSLDPAIYFLHLGYQYAVDGNIDTVKTEPGDTFQYRMGAGYAFSDRVILSFQLVGDVIQEGQNGQTGVASEHQISFQFANTILIGRDSFIEPLVSFGLTPEAPDVMFGLSFPVGF